MTDCVPSLNENLQPLLGRLPPAAAGLCASAVSISLRKGDALLREGERWKHLWWVGRGAFRLFYLDRNGHAANKNFYLEGAMLWPITHDLAANPVAFWVEALESSEVWAIPWADWQAATQAFAPWQDLERRVLGALLQDKMQREQHFLQRSATERYQALLREHPQWVERISLRQLASYLGITDVALSRIRRRLASA